MERIIDRDTDLSVHCNHCEPIAFVSPIPTKHCWAYRVEKWVPCADCSAEMNLRLEAIWNPPVPSTPIN